MALVLSLGLAAPWGQTSRAAADDEVAPIYHKDRSFRIPFDLGDKDLSRIKELQLWASEDEGAHWTPVSKATPDLKAFTFRARHDGEHWFAVRTMSVSGQYSPPREDMVRPALKVVVDTLQPTLVLESNGRQGSTARVRWEVKDENLDLSTLHLEYQAPGAREWARVPVRRPVALGSQGWDARTVEAIRVRASVADKAGNAISTEIELPEGASEPPDMATLDPESVSAPQVQRSPRPGSGSQIQADSSFSPVDDPTAPAPGARGGQVGWAGSGSRGPIARPARAGADSLVTSAPPAANWDGAPGQGAFGAAPPSAFGDPAPSASSTAPAPARPSGFPDPFPNPDGGNAPAPAAGPAPNAGGNGGGASMLVGSPRFKLQYAVDDAGPGGPAVLELWVTRDGGRTWSRRGEDPDRTSPIDVDLGGEGTFGISLVARSSSGLGDQPPAAGERPQTWVEVDSTPPTVQLFPPEIGTGVHAGKIAISWRSGDLHLAPKPVTILWRPEQPGVGWTTVVEAQDPSGQFVWAVPPHFPPKFHIRVEAVDAAGNRGGAETSEGAPVIVDRSRPRSRIIGLDPNARTGDGPNAHPIR